MRPDDGVAAVGRRVRRTSDDAVLCERLVLGESFRQRFMGLMGRGALDADEGLYLETSSIHMMFMRFPIDALFLSKPDNDGTRRVVGIREDLPAWRGIVMPVRHAEGVVELPAGTLARHGVRVDDIVTFEESDTVSDAPGVSSE
jgi:uncharacterized membrane protein (UPF0127 family)